MPEDNRIWILNLTTRQHTDKTRPRQRRGQPTPTPPQLSKVQLQTLVTIFLDCLYTTPVLPTTETTLSQDNNIRAHASGRIKPTLVQLPQPV